MQLQPLGKEPVENVFFSFFEPKPATYNRDLIMFFFFCFPTDVNDDITSASAAFMPISLASTGQKR